MTSGVPNEKNGEKYHYTCVHFCLFLENEIAAILCKIGKIHTKVWAYILRNIDPMKRGSFFRSALVYVVHISMIFPLKMLPFFTDLGTRFVL